MIRNKVLGKFWCHVAGAGKAIEYGRFSTNKVTGWDVYFGKFGNIPAQRIEIGQERNAYRKKRPYGVSQAG